MVIITWAGIFTGVVLFLAWPIIKPRRSNQSDHEDRMELLAGKEEAYSALTDLEFDYQMGKISAQDYGELREKYRFEALALLDRMEEGEEVGELLEQEIKAHRSQRRCCSACGAERSQDDRFCRRCGASLIVAFLLLILPSLAEGALLEGRLWNKTPKGLSVGDVEVTLISGKSGQEEKRTTETDSEGRFRFADLTSAEPYRVNLKYQGAEYEAQVALNKDQQRLQIDIPVYDSTDDPSSIRVKVHHVIVNPGESSLLIEEFLQVENVGERAFIGSKPVDPQRRATIEFALPENAAERRYLTGLMECCVVPAPSGFVDTMDVKPGVREIGFSYTLPVNADQYPLVKRLDYSTEALSVFVGGGVRAQSQGLEAKEAVQVQSGRYLHLAGKNLSSGALVTLELGGLPLRSLSSRYFIFAAISLVLLTGLVFVLVGRKKRHARAMAPEEAIKARYHSLVEDLAGLDDAFEAGKLRPEDYQRLRADKKTELLTLAKRMKGGKDDGERAVL